MNKELSNNEMKKILLGLHKFTVLSDSINNNTSFASLTSTIKKSSNSSIIIEVIKDKAYYIYDSYNNLWVETNNISFYNFQVPHSYKYYHDDLFNLKMYL